MKFAYTLYLGICAIALHSAKADYFAPTELPAIPSGCSVHIYGPIHELPNFIPKNAKHTTDWTEFYKSAGVPFKKGFAYFYKPSETLIIAATKADFDLIDTVVATPKAEQGAAANP